MNITFNEQVNPFPTHPFFAYGKHTGDLILVMGKGINSFCYDAFLVSSKSSTYLPFQYRSAEWIAHDFIPFVGDIKIEC